VKNIAIALGVALKILVQCEFIYSGEVGECGSAIARDADMSIKQHETRPISWDQVTP
jgi:hypothetical protein